MGELILSPDELVVAAGMAAPDANTRGYFGKTMLILMLGFTVKDMYDATVEPINRYERARRYTKDAVILLVTALSEQYLEKVAEKVSEKLCDTKFVRGFADFVMDTEISDRKTLAKVFFAEGDTEVFQAVSNYMDGEALSYLTAEIGNHADLKARDVAKVVLKCAQKNDDTPIDLEDAKFILRGMADGTEESVIVSLFKTSYGKSSDKIGDFTNLQGSTIGEILDRIPDEAVLRELHPTQGGATEGFEFKWVQDGQTYRVRVHNADPSAPVGSNAYNGWIVRIQRGKKYFDPTINDFREAKYFNPNGPDFNENIVNDTHIPIVDPHLNEKGN